MRYDKYSIPIYNSQDIFELIYQGKIDKLSEIQIEPNTETSQLESVLGIQLNAYIPEQLETVQFDELAQTHWFMPDEYKELDIENYILSLITPWDNANSRVLEELEEFKNRNMLDLLRWLKYFVDFSIQNNIVLNII